MEKHLTADSAASGAALTAPALTFNPIMLTLAREAESLSQSQLAKLAGVNQGSLSRFENGLHQPTDLVAQALATHARVPVSLFYVGGQDRPLPLTFYRKKSRLGVKELRAIQARINLTRLRMEILLRKEEFEAPRLLLVDARERRGNVEQIATELRLHWGLPDGPIDNLTAALERFGVLVVSCDFGTAQIDGLSIFEPNSGFPPMIFVRPTLAGDRLRFTIAHELAHIVLHHHLAIPDENADVEVQANRFAAELLMPGKILRGQLMNLNMARLAQLKLVWKVAMAALLVRAHNLGTISALHEKHLWMQLGKAGRTIEPVHIPPEQPARVGEMVRRFVQNYGYSVREMSALVHQQPEQFRSQFMMQTTHLQLS